MSVPLATATLGHLPRSPIGTATDGYLGLAVAPPVEPPIGVDSETGSGAFLIGAPNRINLRAGRVFLRGKHRGANWSTGLLSAEIQASGSALGAASASAQDVIAYASVNGSSASHSAGKALRIRVITPPSMETQRNALALLALVILKKK